MSAKIVEIIQENDSFVAINKSAGLLSIPDRERTQPSLKDLLQSKYGNIFVVHRLDKETSGIILFAKTEKAQQFFSKQFEDRSVEKFYLGIVHGSPSTNKGIIDQPIIEHPSKDGRMMIDPKGKPSVTDYEVLESFGRFSQVKFQLHTGRTHQIRLHAKNIGHPLVCDNLYGDGKPFLLSSIKKKYKLSINEEDEKPILNRLALHSYQLRFKDIKGITYNLEAPLPKDMKATLQQLRKNSS